MHVECWGTGLDFYAATPFYVVSNLCKKKKSSSWLSPIEPTVLVEGVMSQLGKNIYGRYVVSISTAVRTTIPFDYVIEL